MPKHKIQRWTPNTCDPIMRDFEIFDGKGDPFIPAQFESRSLGGCKLLQYWDSLNPSTPPVVVGYDQICPAHEVPTDAGAGKIKWHTGNWKNKEELIAEQRQWFLWLNHKMWLIEEKGTLDDMPEQIKYQDGKSGTLRDIEPNTPVTVSTPSKRESDDLDQVALWNSTDNARVGVSIQIIREWKNTVTREEITWNFTDKGDDRLLHISAGEKFDILDRSIVQASIDVQFGTGKVVVG